MVVTANLPEYPPKVERQPGKRVDWNAPGHAHELTLSSYRKKPLFIHDPVRRILLDVLAEVRTIFDLQVWAYVLMPDHVHILLYPNRRVYDIEEIRARFKKASGHRIVSWLKQHHPECLEGTRIKQGDAFKHRIWQEGKGYDRNFWTPPLIWKSIRYIHGNPVAAGLCESPADWPWSSYRFYEGVEPIEFPVDACPIEDPDPDQGVLQIWWEPE